MSTSLNAPRSGYLYQDLISAMILARAVIAPRGVEIALDRPLRAGDRFDDIDAIGPTFRLRRQVKFSLSEEATLALTDFTTTKRQLRIDDLITSAKADDCFSAAQYCVTTPFVIDETLAPFLVREMHADAIEGAVWRLNVDEIWPSQSTPRWKPLEGMDRLEFLAFAERFTIEPAPRASLDLVLGSATPAQRKALRLERKNNETERAYLAAECATRIAELGLNADEIDTDTLRLLHHNLSEAAAKRKKIKVVATSTGIAIFIACAALLQYILKPDTIKIVDVAGGMRRDAVGRPHPTYVVEWTSTLKQPCTAFHILRDGVDVTAKEHIFTMPGTTTCAFEDRSPPLADRAHVREVHYRVWYGSGRSRITSAAARSCDECVNATFSMAAKGFPIAEHEALPEDAEGKHTMVGFDTPFDLTLVDLSHANAPIDVRQHAEVRSDLQVRCDFGDDTPVTILPVGAIRHVYTKEGVFRAHFVPIGVQTQPVWITVRVAARGDRLGGQRAKRLVSAVPDNGELVVAMRTGDSVEAPKNVIHARHGERVTIFFVVPEDARRRLIDPRGFVFAWFDNQHRYLFDARTAEMRVIPEVWPPNMLLNVSHTWPTAGSRTMVICATDHQGVEVARYVAELQVH